MYLLKTLYKYLLLNFSGYWTVNNWFVIENRDTHKIKNIFGKIEDFTILKIYAKKTDNRDLHNFTIN